MAFKAKNDAQTTSELLQTNFQKVQKTGFLTLKMFKMTLSEAQILAYNFDFTGHISTFGAKNTPKCRPFKAKNNAQTTSEQIQTNFQKVQKTIFLTQKVVKSRVPTLAKSVNFWCNFDLKPLILA